MSDLIELDSRSRLLVTAHLMMSYRSTEIYVAQLVITLQALDIMLQLFIYYL